MTYPMTRYGTSAQKKTQSLFTVEVSQDFYDELDTHNGKYTRI